MSLQKFDSELNSLHQQRYFSIHSLCILSFTAIFAIFEPIIFGYLSLIVLAFIIGVFCKIIFPFSLLEILGNILSNKEDPKYSLLGLFCLVFYCLISLGFYDRLFVTDSVFVERANNRVLYLISRSYCLTKNNKSKIYLIILLSGLVTLPIWTMCYFIVPVIAWLVFTTFSIDTLKSLSLLLSFCFIITLVCAHGIVLPFWQSIKAITFARLNQRDS